MNKVIKNIFSVMIFKIIIAIFGFVTAIFISRTLGPELKGDYSLIMLFPVIIYSLGNFSIGLATNYFSAKKKYNLSKVLTNSLLLAIVLSIILFCGGFLLRIATKGFFLSNIPDNIIYLALFSVIILLLSTVLNSFLLGQKKFTFCNTIFLIMVALKLILTVVFYFVLKELLFAYVLAFVLSQLLVLPLLINEVKKIAIFLPLKRFSLLFSKKICQFGIKNQLNSILILLEFKIDLLLIFFFSGSLNVGYYSVAVIVSEISNVFSNAINSVLFPEIAGTNNLRNVEKIKNIGIFLSCFFSILFSLLVFFTAPLLIELLFGQDFMPAVAALKIMAFVTFFANIKKVILNNFSAQNLIHLANPVSIISLVINIILNIYLIPRIGITGAAYSSLVSYLFSVITLTIIYKIYYSRKLSGRSI